VFSVAQYLSALPPAATPQTTAGVPQIAVILWYAHCTCRGRHRRCPSCSVVQVLDRLGRACAAPRRGRNLAGAAAGHLRLCRRCALLLLLAAAHLLILLERVANLNSWGSGFDDREGRICLTHSFEERSWCARWQWREWAVVGWWCFTLGRDLCTVRFRCQAPRQNTQGEEAEQYALDGADSV
jgi:hypothetical protein